MDRLTMSMARMELEKLKEEHNLREPSRGDLDDKTIMWRSGKPDYAKANLAFLKGKTQNHKTGMFKLNLQNTNILSLYYFILHHLHVSCLLVSTVAARFDPKFYSL